MRMSGSMPADAVEDYPAKFTPVSTTASTAAYGAGPLSSTAVAYGSAGATGSSTLAPPPAPVPSAASIAAGGSGGELGADVSNMPIMPVHDTSVSIRVATPATVDLSDMRRFLTSPLPKSAGILQCTIMRDRSGITNRLYPVYSLYAFEGSQFLMAGRKRGSNKTSNYLVSMDRRDLNRDSTSFLGKVRGNFLGTEFVAYDDGEAPKPSKGLGTSTRTELAFVHYASNVLGSRGPRKMRIAIPKVTPDDRRVVFQPIRYAALVHTSSSPDALSLLSHCQLTCLFCVLFAPHASH
ncbi:MAG: hypothetical protein EOO65_01930 [Methanosarcinales archaeon]|nr:MAG: hypothetical protein EOO65_01930 [Methanosarcinales archaeon]